MRLQLCISGPGLQRRMILIVLVISMIWVLSNSVCRCHFGMTVESDLAKFCYFASHSNQVLMEWWPWVFVSRKIFFFFFFHSSSSLPEFSGTLLLCRVGPVLDVRESAFNI